MIKELALLKGGNTEDTDLTEITKECFRALLWKRRISLSTQQKGEFAIVSTSLKKVMVMNPIKKKLKTLALIKQFIKKNSAENQFQAEAHDDSIYDKETRDFLKKFIPEKIIRFDKKREIKVLMLGSPGLQEIRDLPVDILARFEITGVDKAHKKPLGLPVKKYKFRKINIFDFFKKHNSKNKFDIVLNRWFLHHISEHNKEILCKKIYNILSDNGFLITIDWFIDDWETPDELRCSQIKFYEYRIKYLPHQCEKSNKIKEWTPAHWWDKLHDDKDWSGGKHPSRKRFVGYLKNAGFKNIETHNVGNTDIIDDPYLWGDVLVFAQKQQRTTVKA